MGEALAYIQKETGAEIVLSSTWRLWEGRTGRDAVDKADWSLISKCPVLLQALPDQS